MSDELCTRARARMRARTHANHTNINFYEGSRKNVVFNATRSCLHADKEVARKRVVKYYHFHKCIHLHQDRAAFIYN